MLDPTVAEILLAPELKGLGAREFGAAVSIIFEIVLRDGSIKSSEVPAVSRLSPVGIREIWERFITDGIFYRDGAYTRSAIADRIGSRTVLASALLSRITEPTEPSRAASKPRRERAPEPRVNPDGYTPEFEEFWSRYKAIGGTQTMNKHQSSVSFERALKRGALLADIMDGLDKYSKRQAKLFAENNGKRAFVKMPTTWLNQSDWASEYTDPVKQTPKGFSDPDKAPTPKAGTDFFQSTKKVIQKGEERISIMESVYKDGYVRFSYPAWYRSQGFPIKAERWQEALNHERVKRGAEPISEPDRSREPIEGKDFYEDDEGSRFWPATNLIFDSELWKLGHGD